MNFTGVFLVVITALLIFIVWTHYERSRYKTAIARIEEHTKIANPRLHRLLRLKQNEVRSIHFVTEKSYTLNKQTIFMCSDFRRANVSMYVYLHEVAHVLDHNNGHGASFHAIFRELVQVASDCGVYKIEDYATRPVDYCGFQLSSQIM